MKYILLIDPDQDDLSRARREHPNEGFAIGLSNLLLDDLEGLTERKLTVTIGTMGVIMKRSFRLLALLDDLNLDLAHLKEQLEDVYSFAGSYEIFRLAYE